MTDTVLLYWPMLVLLAMHSLCEGVALGIVNEPVYQGILFTSIALHKGLESIVFSHAALGTFSNRGFAYSSIILFAALTPLGVYAGEQLMLFHPHHTLIAATLNIFSAAMFIYMGLNCVWTPVHMLSGKYIRPSVMGLCLVAGISALSGHQHTAEHTEQHAARTADVCPTQASHPSEQHDQA